MTRIAAPLALIFALSSAALAQESPTHLTVGRAHADSLAGQQADTFAIDLEAGSFVTGVVDQRSVDVTVRVQGPSGAALGSFDRRSRGSEAFRFDADSAGTYRLEVRPVGETSGRYAIEVTSVEPVATDPPARLDQLMAGFEGDDVPGGVVAVVRDGEVIFSRAYGMADLTHAVPFEVDTPTNIGSTSKQFTGFALSLLAERGELSLEDDVREHIPELPDFGPTVTLRNLLTHTTGYREFVNTLVLTGRRFDAGDFIDRAEVIEVVQRQPELQNQPGAEFNYNNTAFGLATVVVERVTGQSFPEWMEENVFRPLGMDHSRVRAHPAQIVPGRSRGYVPDKEEGWREADDLGGSMGAGGIYTTALDLARWMANFATGEVGGPDLFERMTTRYVLTGGDTTSYGLGLFVDEHRGLRRVHHGGSDVAHRSMLRYYPEIRAGVVALSNNATFPSGPIADQMAEAFFGEHMEAAGARPVVAAEPAAFDPETFDQEDFDVYAGRYALDEAPATVLRFWREGARMLMEAAGQPPAELVPTSDSTFALKAMEASVTFHRGPRRSVPSLTVHQNGDHTAKRLEGAAWAPSPEELAVYAGRYFSEELETFYEIAMVEKGLVLKQRRFAEDVKLEPGQRPDAFTGGFPVAEVVFQRDAAGKVVALEVGNGRTRGVRFEKVGSGTFSE